MRLNIWVTEFFLVPSTAEGRGGGEDSRGRQGASGVRRLLFVLSLLLHLLAAMLPLWSTSAAVTTSAVAPPTWPEQFAGRPLRPLDLTAQEARFSQGFPGHVARFTDGSREIILRWVHVPTRRLHPAADCLKGVGYAIRPQPIRVDTDDQHWGCVRASRAGQHMQVCERVFDHQGQSWSDVASWYWATALARTTGPWWAVTVAEHVP